VKRLLTATLACAALIAGCGGSDEPVAVRVTPDDGGVKPMEPGRYRSSKFRPRVSFDTDRRFWQLEYETGESLSLWDYNGKDQKYDDGSTLHILRPFGLFDRKNPSDRQGMKWPGDMARWLRDESGLKVTATRRAKLAGLPAQVLDARAPKEDLRLFLDADYQEYFVNTDRLLRLYVLDAGDEERVIALNVPEDKGAEGFEPLERVARTIRFGS
jgi:hypothetical protein